MSVKQKKKKSDPDTHSQKSKKLQYFKTVTFYFYSGLKCYLVRVSTSAGAECATRLPGTKFQQIKMQRESQRANTSHTPVVVVVVGMYVEEKHRQLGGGQWAEGREREGGRKLSLASVKERIVTSRTHGLISRTQLTQRKPVVLFCFFFFFFRWLALLFARPLLFFFALSFFRSFFLEHVKNKPRERRRREAESVCVWA